MEEQDGKGSVINQKPARFKVLVSLFDKSRHNQIEIQDG